MTDSIGVVLVDDHALTRVGLRAALEAGGVRVLAEVADGLSAPEIILRERPSIAIVDIGLPGQNGIQLTRAIKLAAAEIGVVILTMHEVESEILDALYAGADAYCVKSSAIATVIDAVRIVAAGGAYVDPRIARVVLHQLRMHARTPDTCPLTVRELDVMRLIVDGVGNAEIANRLHVSLGTVKGHVRDILAKLGASDRTHAAVTATRRGYL
jgi:DNA-binding NarL/FixJ family response regulator